MSFPVMQFPIQSYQQTSPGLTAASNITQTLGQIFQNQQQQIQNQYLPQQLQQKALADRYNNQILQSQAQYAPQTSLAALQQAQANIPKTQAETKKDLADAYLAGNEAELKKFFIKNPLLSTTGDSAQIGALIYLQQHPELNNPPGVKTTPGNQGQNPQLTPQGVVNASGNMGTPSPANAPQNTGQPGQQQLPLPAFRSDVPNAAQQQPQPPQSGFAPQQILPQTGDAQQPQNFADMLKTRMKLDADQKAARANYFNVTPSIRAATNPTLLAAAATNRDIARGMADTLANQVSPGTKATEQDVDNIMQYAADAALRKVKTGTQINQMQYGSNLETILGQGDELMPSVVKYAGLAGKFKSGKDAAAAGLGSMPDDYSNYLKFVNVTVPMAAGEISRTLGKQATDQETRTLTNVANPDYWNSNPQLALQQWNWLVQSVKGKNGSGGIGQSLAASNANIRSQLGGRALTQGTGNGNMPTLGQQNQGSDMVTIEDPSGGRHQILRSNLDKAIKKYPGTKLAQ